MKPRKTWIAVILSLLCPGLGHIYAGSLGYGLTFSGLNGVVQLASATFLNRGFGTWVLSLIIGGLINIAALVTAVLCAKAANRNPTGLRRFQQGWAYVGYFVVCAMIGAGIAFLNPMRSFHIPASSMEPTILNGDAIFADVSAYRIDTPRRGDLILFWYPKDESYVYLKRVIGLPGDTISMRGEDLYVNGEKLAAVDVPRSEIPGDIGEKQPVLREKLDGRSYYILKDPHVVIGQIFPFFSGSITGGRSETGGRPSDAPVVAPSVLVPKDSFFVLGDNRGLSNDSRYWGFVPKDKILGKARFIYFSQNSEKRVIWNRLGSRLD